MPDTPEHKELEGLVGSRADDSVPVKSLQDAGARVTLSSDWDVSELNPFIGMSNALNRKHQSVDLKVSFYVY